MTAAALVQGLAGALLTPGAFVMVATLAAAAIVVWTRRPLPGLIVAAWLSLGPIFSVFSWVATPLLTTYSASKAAAWSFTNAARIELRRRGTQVVGVHAGPVDTDMAAAFDLVKIPPATVATAALDALEADEPEAVVDDYSRAIKAGLSDDQDALYPQIEREFLAITGAETTAT